MIVAIRNNNTTELYEINKVTSKKYDTFFDIRFISSTIEISISRDFSENVSLFYMQNIYNKIIKSFMNDGYINLTDADYANWQKEIIER